MEKKLEVLGTVYDYIQRVEKQICGIADLIRSGAGYENIPQFVEGITYVIEAFNATKDVKDMQVDIEDIKTLTQDVLDGMENEDYNLVADIFEYEFYPIVKTWKLELEEVLNK